MSKGQKKIVIDKNDLRKLLKEKTDTTNASQNRIDSPHARYNAIGQLWCTLCNRHVKSNILWNVHLQSRTHKDAAKVGIETSATAISLKRKATDTDEIGGLEKKPSRDLSEEITEKESSSNDLAPTTSIAEQLPEGFFDDPIMDAKARQVPYKDKMEDEWELFQKTMKEENIVSEALVEEDDELREVERNIEEIDDQLCRWSRVTDLLKKREEFSVVSSESRMRTNDDSVDSESEQNDDFDEFSDWRAGGK